MGKVTIYVPDSLESEAKAAGLSLSTLTQRAIREELERVKAKDAATGDLDAVVRRLRTTMDEDEAKERRKGHDDGVRWAREYATVAELGYVASEFKPGRGGAFESDHLPTILDFFRERHPSYLLSVRHEDARYWHGFVTGAGEVWEAVEKQL